MSLVIINLLFPNKINKWINHVNGLKNSNYNKGAIIAKKRKKLLIHKLKY